MKLPILLSSMALIVSGLALLSSLTSEEEHRESGEITPQSDATSAELRGEIAELRESLERLSVRLEMLADRPVAPARIPAGDLVEQSDLDALRTDLLAELGATGSQLSGSPAGADGLKQEVAAALDDVRRAEREAKREASRSADRAKLEAQMPKLQQELGLTAWQTDELQAVLVGRSDRIAEMTRLWQEGDLQAAGEMKSNERELFGAELQGVLNEQQVEQFRSMNGGRGRGGK